MSKQTILIWEIPPPTNSSGIRVRAVDNNDIFRRWVEPITQHTRQERFHFFDPIWHSAWDIHFTDGSVVSFWANDLEPEQGNDVLSLLWG